MGTGHNGETYLFRHPGAEGVQSTTRFRVLVINVEGIGPWNAVTEGETSSG